MREKFGSWILRIIALLFIIAVCVAAYWLLVRFNILETGLAVAAAAGLFVVLLIIQRQSEILHELKQVRSSYGPNSSIPPALEARLSSIERKLAGVTQTSKKGAEENRELLLSSIAEIEKQVKSKQDEEKEPPHMNADIVTVSSSGLPVASMRPLTDVVGDISSLQPEPAAAPAVLSNDKNINMHLQPIVNLPDRTPVFFDAFMRLKSRDGGYVEQRQLYKLADSGGLLPAIEMKVILSSGRLLQKLNTLKKPAKVFCGLSGPTLDDEKTSQEILAHLAQHQSVCQNLVLYFDQRTYSLMKTPQKKYLTQLKKLGISFCLSNVLDLKIDPQKLERRGFKFVRVASSILLHASQDGADVIAKERLAETLESHGIDLISNDIEREKDVLGLIDLDVLFAQGTLFAPPRPVKTELVGK